MKDKKKLLFCTEFFYPDNSTTSYYITEIARELSLNKQLDIEIICNSDLGDEEELDFAKGKIWRISESSLNKNNLLSRGVRFIYSSFKMLIRTNCILKPGSVIFSITNPPFFIIFLAVLKKVRKFKLYFLVYDVFPENLVAAGLLSNKSIIYRIVRTIFNWAYIQADHLIVIGRDMKELVGNKTNFSVGMSLITNWSTFVDDKFHDKKNNQLVKKYQLEDKLVFAFVGNLGRVQGIQNMLDMALSIVDPRFVLLFIGDGAFKNTILKHIDDSSKKNVIYAGSFPPSEIDLFMNCFDVAVVSLNSSMYGLGVPSKSYNNMAAGKPLLYIGDRQSEIGRVVEDFKIGWVVPPGDVTSLSLAVKLICDNPDLINVMGAKARRVVEENFSRQATLDKYSMLFKFN